MPNDLKRRRANGDQAIGYPNSTNESGVMQLEERRIHMKLSCGATPPAHSRWESVETKLQRIAQKAAKEPRFQFSSLYHLMNEELLGECFEKLRRNAASGIDGLTKTKYAENLSANLSVLVKRLHSMSYRPLAVRRVYIPKVGSRKMRPLGIPALEDKLVQAGLVRILEQIYENDFIDHSYGFRPGRGCHDALRALSGMVEKGSVNYIVEADIKNFFDNVDHEWLMKFLGHRIIDKRVLQMIKRFLIAGVVEDGKWQASKLGTPQGGVISPLLANIYLHYALDLWFKKAVSKESNGGCHSIRYADDFVCCFQRKDDAQKFHDALSVRLKRFNLEVEPTKTKLLAFGKMAAVQAARQGVKPETFDFLGFTHFCSKTRDGKRFRMKRRTARKKFTAKLKAFKEWLRSVRTWKTRDILEHVKAKLAGHFAYYGVTDNSPGIERFAYEVSRILQKWLNRRGRRKCWNWDRFNRVILPMLPKPRIKVSLF